MLHLNVIHVHHGPEGKIDRVLGLDRNTPLLSAARVRLHRIRKVAGLATLGVARHVKDVVLEAQDILPGRLHRGQGGYQTAPR